MAFDVIGRRFAGVAAIVLVAVGVSACTTTEGTNAFTDFQTFDDEVLGATAEGLGLIPREEKADPTNPRAPLALPKDDSNLPPPTTDTTSAALPKDSNQVKLDTTGLSQQDIARLKRVRVVDPVTLGGRPLTAEELKQLTSKMQAAKIRADRSIFLPPERYYSTIAGGEDLVCLAATGDLVSVSDPACPPEIRKALLKQ
jgi:hypothetical protein